MENFSISISKYQEDICSSSLAFVENLQIVLNISEDEAMHIVESMPHEVSSGLSENEAKKLAGILEAFGAVVILKDNNEIPTINEDKDDSIFGATKVDPILFDLEVDEEEVIKDDLFIEKLEETKPKEEIKAKVEKPAALTEIAMEPETVKVPEVPKVTQDEVIQEHKPEPILISPVTSPFLIKKRSTNLELPKKLIPVLVCLPILLIGVYFLNTEEKKEESALSIKVDADLVKTLLKQGENVKKPKPEEKPTSHYYEGEVSTEIYKIKSKLSRSEIAIESLKLNLETLTDQQTTAEEFINNKFTPHLNSFEIDVKEAKKDESAVNFEIKATARLFYTLKNNASKSILDITLGIFDNDLTLVIASSPSELNNKDLNSPPSLKIENETVTFAPFRLTIPLNKTNLVIPQRKVLLDSDIKAAEPNGKEAKKKKKAEKKVVDE